MARKREAGLPLQRADEADAERERASQLREARLQAMAAEARVRNMMDENGLFGGVCFDILYGSPQVSPIFVLLKKNP